MAHHNDPTAKPPRPSGDPLGSAAVERPIEKAQNDESFISANAPNAPEALKFSPHPPFDTIVTDKERGERLDRWLCEQISGLTRSRTKSLIESGALKRDGEVFTDPSWRLKEGESYHFEMPDLAPATPEGEAIALDVQYEDNDIIVVNKPAGMVVHPAAGNWTGTLVNALIAHCGDSLSGIGGVARPGIVHRLDKETSGLIVVAKHDAAHLKLTQAWAVHDIDRAYDALALGAPRPSVGVVDAALVRADGDRKRMMVVEGKNAFADDGSYKPGVRHAVTHYNVTAHYGRGRAKLAGDSLACHLVCRLETGRTHQIRAHMTHIGHPLIGDPVYGRGPGVAGLKPGDRDADKALHIIKKFRRQALHARILGFEHPITGEALHFEQEPPDDFKTLQAALEQL